MMLLQVLPWPWNSEEHRFLYTLIVMACQYFVPLGVLSCSYANIAYVLWIKRTPGEPEHRRDQRLADAKIKVCSAWCWCGQNLG